MLKIEQTPQVVRYVYVMRVLGALYGLSALIFFFLPGAIFYILNFIPKFLGLLEVIPDSSELFWLPLAASMMVMLSVLAFSAAASPELRILALVQIISKLCTSLGYLYLFFTAEKYFAYLVGFLTDFPIFLFVFWLTFRMSILPAQSGEESDTA